MYSVWLMFPGARIQFFTEDKVMIGECHWLNDCYINFVQAMLRVRSPKCNGIKNTLLQNQRRLTIANKIVQILHIHDYHWVVISNVHCSGNDFSMYDTICDDICTSAMALVSSIFKENVNVSIVPQVQKQQGDVDCGAFSITITWFISWPT